MRQLRTIRGLYVIGSGIALLIALMLPGEVEKEVSSANQVMLEMIVGDDPESVAGRLRAEQALCPRRIDENTILKSVTLWKVNCVKYLYEVNESGRPRLVNWGNKGDVRAEIVERMKTSHLGPCVVNNGLNMNHVFEDTDGMSLLGVQLEEMHFRGVEFGEPLTAEEIERPEPSPTEEADREEFAKLLKAEQDKCPQKITEHVTLEEVERLGKNRIKFHYRVPHAKYVSMNNQDEVEARIIKRMNASPLAPLIKKLDVQMVHFYREKKNNCTLWLNMTRHDVFPEYADPAEPSEQDEALAEAERKAAEEAALAAARKAKYNNDSWLPQEFKPSGRTLKNPAGIQTNPYVK